MVKMLKISKHCGKVYTKNTQIWKNYERIMKSVKMIIKVFPKIASNIAPNNEILKIISYNS